MTAVYPTLLFIQLMRNPFQPCAWFYSALLSNMRPSMYILSSHVGVQMPARRRVIGRGYKTPPFVHLCGIQTTGSCSYRWLWIMTPLLVLLLHCEDATHTLTIIKGNTDVPRGRATSSWTSLWNVLESYEWG